MMITKLQAFSMRLCVAAASLFAYVATMETPKPNPTAPESTAPPAPKTPPKEIGGSSKPEPTRYGDWEVDGRCTDF